MARVDVFRKLTKRGAPRYYLVPIYPHQIADREGFPRPPDRAVVSGMPESGWAMTDDADFLFSLFSHSLLEVAKSDGEVIRGYFKGLDRATGAIAIARPENMRAPPIRVGAKTLAMFVKLHVDRLGRTTPVSPEIRTWHGAACT
jgi:CRISPR-associated endonuclease Csn1